MAATRLDTVGAAVRSVVNQTHRDWELVVVTQGPSAAKIADTVREAVGNHEARVILQPGRGLSRARNACVAAASGELIAMIDDDCEADPGWLEALIAALRSTPHAGVVGGPLVPPPRTRRGPGFCPGCLPADILFDPLSDPGADLPPGFDIAGGNFAVLRSAAELIGPFDEYLGPGAMFPVADEMDFLRRAATLGIAIRTTPAAVVHHTGGWRYGARAVWKLNRSYALGNGAHAAKITLLGDPRGERALREVRRMAARDWLARRRPAALPAGLGKYHYFAQAYRECLTGFVVDSRGILRAQTVDEPRLALSSEVAPVSRPS
jgi:GT2 family glycosyltransferase